jgi:integrase
VIAEPDHKKSTKTFYGQIFPLIRKSLPLERRTADWSKDEVKAWWAAFSKDRSASQCNICLHTVRRAMKGAVEAGVRRDDPTADIKRKRMPKRAVEELPGLEVLESLLSSMREKRGKSAANMVEFLAWSGVRIGELREITWEQVGEKWLTVAGGEEGTKNHEVRRVPINSRLADLLARLRYEGAEGKIFNGATPRKALNLACDRIGIPRLRIHDLRHWFATHCIERGVDIPTVSKWLGHKDGGALAMRVYGHLRDDHSLSAARKLG